MRRRGRHAVAISAARMLVLGMLVTGLTTACHRGSRAPARTGDWVHLTLTPASFGQVLNLQQQVHVEAPGQSINLDAVLDIAPDAVTLVGLMLGQRMFTMRYDGKTLTEQRHPFLPAEVHGADILTDVQLALWPADAVRAALPPGWTLRDEGTRRTLLQSDKDVAVITYEATPRWQGRFTVQNLRFEYTLVIRSVVSPS